MEQINKDVLIIGGTNPFKATGSILRENNLNVLDIRCFEDFSLTEVESYDKGLTIYGYSSDIDMIMIDVSAIILMPDCSDPACRSLSLETGIIGNTKTGFPIIDDSMMTSADRIFSFDTRPDSDLMIICEKKVSKYLIDQKINHQIPEACKAC